MRKFDVKIIGDEILLNNQCVALLNANATPSVLSNFIEAINGSPETDIFCKRIENLESKISSLLNDVDLLISEKSSVESEVSRLHRELNRLETRQTKAVQSLAGYETQLSYQNSTYAHAAPAGFL